MVGFFCFQLQGKGGNKQKTQQLCDSGFMGAMLRLCSESAVGCCSVTLSAASREMSSAPALLAGEHTCDCLFKVT